MLENTNGTLYIGPAPGREGFFINQAIFDGDFLIADNAVVAGPVTLTGTVTVTGTLVIV